MADIVSEVLKLSRSERTDVCKGAVVDIVKFCDSQGLNDEQTISFLCALTKLFVSVDRSCKQAEYDLFIDVTGFKLSTDQFFEMTNYGGNREFIESVLHLVSLMSEDAKRAVAIFGLCICSADGEVTPEERDMIARTVA